MQSQLGATFDPELFDQPIIRRQFLDQMIDEELLAQVSIDAGLAVDDQRWPSASGNSRDSRWTVSSMRTFTSPGWPPRV